MKCSYIYKLKIVANFNFEVYVEEGLAKYIENFIALKYIKQNCFSFEVIKKITSA